MLRDSFEEARDKIREHEAIDILAPRRTPVVAVEDGTIVKFFTSITWRPDDLSVRRIANLLLLLRAPRRLRDRAVGRRSRQP